MPGFSVRRYEPHSQNSNPRRAIKRSKSSPAALHGTQKSFLQSLKRSLPVMDGKNMTLLSIPIVVCALIPLVQCSTLVRLLVFVVFLTLAFKSIQFETPVEINAPEHIPRLDYQNRCVREARSFYRALCTKCPRVKASSIEEKADCCSVCLNEFEDDDWVRSLPCSGKHLFHAKCIEMWFLTSNNRPACPLCKMDMVDQLASTNKA